MAYDFRGKIAALAGASQGIGLACAQELVRGGADVCICARTPANIEAARKELEELAQRTGSGGAVHAIAVDMSTAEGVQAFVDETVKRFGGIDIAVNSAGGSRSAHFLEIPDEYLLEGWTLKLLGGIRLTRAVTPHMERRGGGSIVLLSGSSTGAAPTRIPAQTTNGAQRSFVAAVRDDLAARNISINLVQPGLVQTRRYTIDMERRARERGISVEQAIQERNTTVPSGHLTQPEEIAELVAFLCARRVHNLTGHEVQCAW